MSRKPQTGMTDSVETDTDTRNPLARSAGRRFSGDESILRLERELVADGVTLENRAIPIRDHAECGDDINAEEIQRRINEETDKEHPNRNRIGYLNERLEAER